MSTIAEKVAKRFADEKLATRVATRYRVALEVGQGVFTQHLKLHHFHGSLRITDMTNAGKRGKKVRELTVIPKTFADDLSDKIIKQAVSSILHMTYDQAKDHLEDILTREGHENLYSLNERELRGIDVEPMGTKINLEKKFPNGEIVTIESSPHEFLIVDSVLIDAEGKAAHGFRQDTTYWPVAKKDGIAFYGWLKDNLSKAANMKMMELLKVFEQLGLRYNSH